MRPRSSLLAVTVALAASGCAFIERSSVGPAGGQQPSDWTTTGINAISADGRYAVFLAPDSIAPGPGNGVADLWRRDHATGATLRVSVSSAGVQANGDSFDPAVSADGRFVAFRTNATNLAAGDPARADIYVRDMVAGTTTRVSTGPIGDFEVQNPSISDDGRYVTFDGGDTFGVYLHDRQSGATELITRTPEGDPADGQSEEARIDPDGSHVVFVSSASNLVTDPLEDVYWYDYEVATGTITQITYDVPGRTGCFPHLDLYTSHGMIAQCYEPNDTWTYHDVDFDTGVATPIMRADGTNLSSPDVIADATPDRRHIVYHQVLGQTAANSQYLDRVHDREHRINRTLLLGAAPADVWGFRSLLISDDGRYVQFETATAYVDADTSAGPDLYVRSTAFITVDSAAPSSLPDGTTTVVTITGTGFRPDTQWGLSADDRSRWTVLSSATIDDDTATMTVKTTAGAASGPINIVAINPGNPWGPFTGAANWCLGGLTIT